MADWLRPWVLLAVGIVTVATVVTPFLEDMEPSHRLVVPAAAAVMLAAWVIDLSSAGWFHRMLSRIVILTSHAD